MPDIDALQVYDKLNQKTTSQTLRILEKKPCPSLLTIIFYLKSSFWLAATV
jgi:hypothetical protein